MKRRQFFTSFAGAAGALLTWTIIGRRKASAQGMSGMMDGGMMGHVTSADMSTYMEMFMHHAEIQRTVVDVRGGVRTTTESSNPRIATQIQQHVAAMYAHLDAGQQVRCMSPNLPTMFREASRYRRTLQLTTHGITVAETSSDPRLTQTIRAHAREVTSFVKDGMPARMREMMP